MIVAGLFTLAGEMNASNAWNPRQRGMTNKAGVEFSIQRKGLYLGFQDFGGCIALGKVQLSSNFCPCQITGGVNYNRTFPHPLGVQQKYMANVS